MSDRSPRGSDRLIRFLPFRSGELSALLGETVVPLLRDDHLRQLSRVETHALASGAQSVVVEFSYVDRDYIEDHSAFYSTSRKAIPNVCRRVHFFSTRCSLLKQKFQAVRRTGASLGQRSFEDECTELSGEYLGFCVIKPLGGCPVGRTVLIPPSANNGTSFGGTRSYKVHVGGLVLTVRGLAFQQQDVGVSACATTALWSAFHKVLDFEEIALPTPAKITTLAALHSLPHGRAMPSEGLSVDQMCQATQAIGLAPVLFRAENPAVTRAYLHAACLSGFAPVLILCSKNGKVRHAVTVCGMHVNGTLPKSQAWWYDSSDELSCVFIHDDRHGPYISARFFQQDLESHTEPVPMLEIEGEDWMITQVLVPAHPKIRIAFSNLTEVAYDLLRHVYAERQIRPPNSLQSPDEEGITFHCKIVRSDAYLVSLITEHRLAEHVGELTTTVPLSRYVGVIRLEATFLDPMEILIDTTSTMRNLHFFAVISYAQERVDTVLIGRGLSDFLRCRFIMGRPT